MTPTALRVVVDRRLCVGTSNCAEEAPDAFEMDESAAPHPIPGASVQALFVAAQACPVGAITLYDAATGRQVYP